MSIRRLWTLGVTALIAVGVLVGTFANYQIDLYGARRAAYEWLQGARRNGPEAYDTELFARLSLGAKALVAQPPVAAALERRAWTELDAAIDAQWSDPRLREHWIAVDEVGRAHGSVASCRGADLAARIDARPRGLVLCGQVPLFFGTHDRAVVDGVRLYTVRIVDDAYATAMRQVSGAEIAIVAPWGDVATSLRDRDGRRLPLAMDPAALVQLRSQPGELFGPRTLSVPRYRGYHNGSDPFHAGASSFDAYVLATPFAGDDADVPLKRVFIVPRDILDLGARYSSIMLAACAIVIGVLLVAGMRALVGRITRPLVHLGAVAEAIGRGDTDVRVGDVGGVEETAHLARAFDEMIARLAALRRAQAAAVTAAETRAEELGDALARLRAAHAELHVAHSTVRETQEKLVRASRRAGMAEVASNVLHNVGNVLNTVNVATEGAQRKLAGSKLGSLERAAAMLPEDPAALAAFYAGDPRATELPRLLRLIHDVLRSERRTIGAELDVLTRSIDHIKNIVRRQQQMAAFDGGTEIAAPADVVDIAIALHGGSGAGPRAIPIVRRIDALPPRALDQHRMVQILLNLLSNARHAVHAAAPDDPCIVVRLVGDDGGFRVEVTDNGVGFAPERRARMFEHGFTTKADGHGFGLHSSANAAVEMGGSLSARSDGPGRGATFVLHVPARAPAARAAA